jgi:hypothetical protein
MVSPVVVEGAWTCLHALILSNVSMTIFTWQDGSCVKLTPKAPKIAGYGGIIGISPHLERILTVDADRPILILMLTIARVAALADAVAMRPVIKILETS